MNRFVLSRIESAISHSELGRAVAAVRRDGGRQLALGEVSIRPLSPEEIQQLEDLGNSADDWSRVQVAEGFQCGRVRHSSFHGDILLGRFAARTQLSAGLELPTGIYRCTLANCVIGHEALVRDVKLLSNYVVGQGAVLHDCGSIVCDGLTTFGNGQELALGIESGGREVRIYAEIDVDVAATMARVRSCKDLMSAYGDAMARYVESVRSPRGIIEQRATIRNTVQVRNTFLGCHAVLDGAMQVSDSTVLSSSEEPVTITSGACVHSSLLQWGTSVATMAIVSRSVLTEHSHVEEHGKVTASIIGPNTGIAKGEVTSCLLGPFVGFHHQALLIAALWPEGKGNVSYGANVGSNHTSKAPDQEFWPGEGAFLGLGVNIKYPTDFSQAPYSIVACGVTTLPQRITFPFSLLNQPSTRLPGISPAYNELIPAWLLSDNLYVLKRNEAKFRTRNRARRSRLECAVFRPHIIALMRDACSRLEGVTQVKDAYTDRDIEGLGKNYLLEAHRLAAIAAYRFYVTYYALLGLKDRVQAVVRKGQRENLDRLLATPSEQREWELQRQILVDEVKLKDVVAGLRMLPGMIERVARDVEQSKAKDDRRGPQIIDDYSDVHVPAAQDPVVRQVWDEANRLLTEVKELLATLDQGRTPFTEDLLLGHPAHDIIVPVDSW